MPCPHCSEQIDHVLFLVTEENTYSYAGDGSACWEYQGNGDSRIGRAVCPECSETLEGLDSFDAVDEAMKATTE